MHFCIILPNELNQQKNHFHITNTLGKYSNGNGEKNQYLAGTTNPTHSMPYYMNEKLNDMCLCCAVSFPTQLLPSSGMSKFKAIDCKSTVYIVSGQHIHLQPKWMLLSLFFSFSFDHHFASFIILKTSHPLHVSCFDVYTESVQGASARSTQFIFLRLNILSFFPFDSSPACFPWKKFVVVVVALSKSTWSRDVKCTLKAFQPISALLAFP